MFFLPHYKALLRAPRAVQNSTNIYIIYIALYIISCAICYPAMQD